MFISKWMMQVNTGVLVPLWLICSTAVAQDRFTLGINVQESWDSNFARNSDVDSEHYTQAAVSLAANQRFSKQDLALSVSGSRYIYDQRDDLNADFYEGQASWRSAWSSGFSTVLTWTRDAYPVDRLEFSGNDVVARDLTKAQFTLRASKQISISAGASQTAQTHSNSLRENLDLDEEEAFVEASYKTLNDSSLSIRLRDGERVYPYSNPDELLSLDYQYQQREFETVWALTPKTRLSATIGEFDRKGEINAGVGTQSVFDASWAVSEKFSLVFGYSQSKPAVGETADSPSNVRGGHIKLAWEPVTKWTINMEASHSELDYDERELRPARIETVVVFTPLSLTYRFSESLAIRLTSQWVDRQSPLLYRDYDYALGSLGFALTL